MCLRVEKRKVGQSHLAGLVPLSEAQVESVPQ